MVVSMKLAAAVMGGLLIATVSTPAWAGSAKDATSTGSPNSATSTDASSPKGGVDRSLIGALSPFLADAAPHEAQKRCRTDSLYSQHDVNGDPDACFLYRVSVPLP
jgi:hypothetical protein